MKWIKYVFIALVVITLVGIFVLNKYSINPPLPLTSNTVAGELPLEKLILPEGYEIEVYATDVVNARSMSLAPSGTLYVGTRSEGNVYALKDTNGDGKIDKKYTLLKEGNMPNGVAYKDGDLYVAEVNRVLKFEDIESKLDNPGQPVVVNDSYPEESHHGWKYIAFGPDDKLYVPVGAPCNICESKEEIYASITRMNADGSGKEVVHSGIRNTVGFTWHPVTKDLWFTDNGRDMLGDNKPDCELNTASQDGNHYGYPYCHQGDILDPEFGKGKNCEDYKKPFAKLGPHTAPLGCEFYTGNQFAKTEQGQLFICRHGSWNRKKKIGYDVVMVDVDNNNEVKPFISGWLDDATDDVWGRPVDVELMPDGSMLISDDYADVIYRVYRKGI